MNWILRSALVGGIVLLFIPSLNLPVPGSRPGLIMLVDVSGSMGSANKQKEYGKFLEDLEDTKKKITLEAYLFADSLKKVVGIKDIAFEGVRTDIFRALDLLEVKDAQAVILVSDGRHNAGEEKDPSLLPVPLWAVALGEEGLPDIGIDEAYLEDSLSLRVRLRSTLKQEINKRLTVYSGKSKVASRQVKLSAEGLTELSLRLSLKPLSSLRLRLESLTQEDRLDNNSFTVHTVPAKRELKVVFAASRISKETHLILSALKRLPGINLHTFIQVSPSQTVGRIPDSPDAVVVGPLSSEGTSRFMESIQNWVEEGVPLMFIIPGEDTLGALDELLFLKQIPEPATDELYFSPLGELIIGPWDIQIHETWCGIPYPGTSILLGRGVSVHLGQGEAPTRTLSAKFPDLLKAIREDRQGFNTFMQRGITYLASGRGFPFSYKVEEANQDRVKIKLFSQVELSPGSLKAWLSPDSHHLRVIPERPGWFELEGKAGVGKYQLKVGWKGETFQPEGIIRVKETESEKPSRGANRQLLSHLAAENNGKLITSEELNDMASTLPRRNRFRFKPIRSPILVGLLGIILLAEIWYRRRTGLP